MKPFAWDLYNNRAREGDPPSGLLPALRRGAGRDPGSVPEMWPHLATFHPEGHLTRSLRAEHICLVLFGLHQQGSSTPVHQSGRTLAQALRTVRDSDRFSQEALDARFLRAIGADQITETEHHLRGLIGQLRGIQGLGFDYTALFHDLRQLQDESQAPRVRRHWGAAYFTSTAQNDESSKETTA